MYKKEVEFEKDLINNLLEKGWTEVLKYPTEKDLINNWKNIISKNNMQQDRLNNQPLSDTEMNQIISKVNDLAHPVDLNSFINGKTVSIKRDNPEDTLHLGKEISLKIYDRDEIINGKSIYQIAQQPQFKNADIIKSDRRGDVMLLINGMPLIHIELKKDNVPVSQAYNQIEKYSKEWMFKGIFSLIQVFVAMTPTETVYFSNPGTQNEFNPRFYFHWSDFNNEPINNWKDVADSLLPIQMVHKLIGFYTIADSSDGILKVLRPYQYYAVRAILKEVSTIKWKESHSQRGGYIWHTTGSGKTMTSFKAAQLIANSDYADKVVFLVDRIELGTQALYEYKSFSNATDDVQSTESTYELITKLKSKHPSDALIVTSVQKMSRIQIDDNGINDHDIQTIDRKRILFIVDEAHRSTFGEMLATIKTTFPNAVFFGFTGTPIYEENKKNGLETTDIFGNELHRYTIADGIRDGNVLGFDPYKCLTYKDDDLRKVVALEKAKAKTEEEVFQDKAKTEVFNKYMSEVSMAKNDKGLGIEDFIKGAQYARDEHRNMVIKDISQKWMTLSQNGKFHAILATNSIPEAIKYYKLFKTQLPKLKVTALFDPNIDNNDIDDQKGPIFKEESLAEIIRDYNKLYGKTFTIPTHSQFKKDISWRLSHKGSYKWIEHQREQQLDILIVVDQMLTGFDSKWVNTLYLDKLLTYENVIQAFSRTNRLFGPDKPYGVIRYYRKPWTMEQNINEAVKYYSGDREIDLFVDKLPENLSKMCDISKQIEDLFKKSNIDNFNQLPDNIDQKSEFAKLFNAFNKYLKAAMIQGFTWEKNSYVFNENGTEKTVDFYMGETSYLALSQRYKELANEKPEQEKDAYIPYDIEGYLTQIDTGKIDSKYLNENYKKYIKQIKQDSISDEELQKTKDELYKSFAFLNQRQQKLADMFINDIRLGNIQLDEGKTFMDYINQYQLESTDNKIKELHYNIGVDIEMLENIMKLNVNDRKQYGRINKLEDTIDKEKAQKYFEKDEPNLSIYSAGVKARKLLRDFIESEDHNLKLNNK